MKVYLFTAFFVFLSAIGESHSANREGSSDTTKLTDIFKLSRPEFRSRLFYMRTENEGLLKDDYALAAGLGAGLTTASYHGFQASVSSFVVYNVLSSDLDVPDPVTIAPNRYEAGLFDISDPSRKANIIRLEDLFLKYTFSGSSVMIGKMKLNTPFINPQDGRMNVTMEEGIWYSSAEARKLKASGGWLWRISPRSTSQWYPVSRSFGLYPSGMDVNGKRSDYASNIESSGIGLLNISYAFSDQMRMSVWDMLVDNVMNTSLVELSTGFGQKLGLYQAAMFIRQDAINHGGNSDQSKAYIPQGAKSNSFSFQAGVKKKRMNTSVAYTHITDDGRYLMPREWGRDPFYTFMFREKNDGFGNVDAYTAKTTLLFMNGDLKTGFGVGYFRLPDVKDYRLNKYGMPSYHQVNIDVTYSFRKFLKGLDLRFMLAYKGNEGETYNNYKYIYNKVNMTNFNLIADFRL